MKSERGFRCGPERHLWNYGLELAIYQKIAAVTWVKSRGEYGTYHATVEKLALFFGIAHQSAQRAVSNLVERGWLERVEPKGEKKTNVRALRGENFRTKHYRIISHEAWEQKHPGHCFVEEYMPWHAETKDALALALHRDSNGKVLWYGNLITALRKTGVGDAAIERAWHEHVTSWDKEPWGKRGWQAKAFRFVAEFCNEHKAKNP